MKNKVFWIIYRKMDEKHPTWSKKRKFTATRNMLKARGHKN